MELNSVTFASSEEAQRVAEQLPQSKIKGNRVFYSDKRALEVAIAVAGVSGHVQPIATEAYPEHERAYRGE